MSESTQRLSIGEKLVLAVIAVVILGASYTVADYMMNNRPRPQRKPPPPIVPLVRTVTLQPENTQVVIDVKGTVTPAVEVDLQAQVSGQIIETHPDLVEGGLVAAGETLVQIDPRDYELALKDAESRLETARYELALEKGHQDIAQREWELLDLKDRATSMDLELALRKPHLRDKEAKLAAAQADVDRARLNLDRTTIEAPFNAIVQMTDVDIGDQATPQRVMARLVGTDSYWVLVSLALDEIKWLDIPNNGGAEASLATVFGGTGSIRNGRILKLLSDLEPSGRMARLLVEVRDPLNLSAPPSRRQPLLLNEYVRADLAGRVVEGVYSIPRNALREGGYVWLFSDEERLDIRKVPVVWQNDERALLRGLESGEQLIVSDIATPVHGMALRVTGPENDDASLPHEGPWEPDPDAGELTTIPVVEDSGTTGGE